MLEKDLQESLFYELEHTKPLPSNFVNTIEKYYPNKFKQGVWESIFQQLIGKPRNQCLCREIYYPLYRKEVKFAAEILALEIEDKFSQEKCYEYLMNTESFGTIKAGIRNASKYFYQKNITELDEKEILKLDIRWRNPSHYRDEKVLARMVSKIINQ